MAIGRISGPLLKANLVRDGVDLAFETDLLFLKVASPTNTTPRVGINTNTPQYDLDVNGTIRSSNLQIDSQLTLSEITFSGNTITSSNNVIDFRAAAGEATVYHSRLIVDDFQLQGNVISTEVSNSSIEIRPNGTGTIQLQSNTVVSGDLEVTGNINATGSITIGGNIIIGDQSTDSITINASIESDLIPKTDNLYALGDPTHRWKDVYVNNLYTTTLNVPELNIGNLSFTNNTITSTPGFDITITGNGTGGVVLGNFKIVNSTITNIVSGAISVFNQTGDGYFQIGGTNGFVPPIGNSFNRPTAYAVIGMTRYNTTSRALEIWDGTGWQSPAGVTGSVNETQANDIAIAFALTLG
jgi:hypothetical protein